MGNTDEKVGVVVYQTWFETAAKLGQAEQEKAIMQILRYGFYGEKPDNPDGSPLDLLFCSWAPLVDAALKRRKGGAPIGNQNAKGHGAPIGNKNAAGHKGSGGRPKKLQTTNKQPFNKNININKNINNNTPSSCGSDEPPTTADGVCEDEEDYVEIDPTEWLREHGYDV